MKPTTKDTLVVNEIFYSIQGESSFAGCPCVLVRLTYCNLRCSYCDTEYAFYEGREMTLSETVAKVLSFPTDLVEITGGEPLLQETVHPLVRCLLDVGKKVLIETGGGVSIREVDSRAILIYDIKCPDSGMANRNIWENLEYLGPLDEVKFVIASRRDYEWSRSKVLELGLHSARTVLFSPVWGVVDPKELADWIVEDGLDVRVQLQLHKILWGAEARAV